MSARNLSWTKRVALVAAAVLAAGGATSAGVVTASAAPVRSTAPATAAPSLSTFSQVLRQPDGFTFKATLSDLEVGGLFETLDGYSVERDEAGVWHYVTGRKDGKVVLGAVVTDAEPPASLAEGAGRVATKVSKTEAAIRDSIERQLAVATARAVSAAGETTASSKAGPKVFHVPALMFATWYDEAAGETTPQFRAGHDQAYFKKILDGFGGNPRGSMTQFYYEASFGQFLVKVDVYGPYTSARSVGDPCYYGDGNGETKATDPAGSALGLGGLGALGMAVEAVPQANADPAMDWGIYDNDGDGLVDFTMIIHSGADHAATGNACDTHSHALQVTLGLGGTAESTLGLPAGTLKVGLPTSTPGVFVDRVVTIPEYASKASPLTIGVATHEMAHAIGEPDYYDTGYTSTGTGDFDIMSGGSYLGNPAGSNPAMMNPATRVFQGWVTPTIVHGNLKNYTIKPRTSLPRKGYRVGRPDPNLLLVPTYEVKVGTVDKLGHTWEAEDVYGLARDPKTKKYVVEGYYVENSSRNATSVKLSKKNPMGSMFDRQGHSSGLAVWHFDYWRQSTTYFGHGNDAQSDPNRYQMDLEEFDQNDNSQELQLNHSRGNPADLLTAAATGITSGTHLAPPGTSSGASGKPQKPIEISGTSTPVTAGTAEFTVDPKANNTSMTVSVNSDLAGDCKLQLTDPTGQASDEVDSGSFGGEETLTVRKPQAGTWTATVGDFAACGSWSGRVIFEGGADGGFVTSGAADTWSNWSEKPTGWAFTNVRGYGNGLDVSNEAGGSGDITLDIMNLSKARDVSPGFVVGRLNKAGGQGGLNVGRRNLLQVPVFSNGGKRAGAVDVVVRADSATGPVVARKRVKLGGYGRRYVTFGYRPKAEGPVRLVATVDPANRVKEANERNQVQVTNLWAGPKKARVLIVDDDQTLGHERALAGALSALGVRYAIYSGHPSAAVLKKYSAVIWSSAVDRYEGQLDKGDRAALKAYLDRGGKVLLTSNRIMDALGTVGSPQASAAGVAFGAHYFGVRIPEGNTTYVVSQVGHSKVTTSGVLGRRKVVLGFPAARPFIGLAGLAQAGNGNLGTVIKPFGRATGVAKLDKASLAAVVPESDPAYIGVAVKGDKRHDSFRTVTLGWNLGDDVSAASTVKVLRSSLRFLGVRTGKAARPGQRLIYTNPVRDAVSGKSVRITAIVLGGKGSVPVRLYYRRHGRGKFYVMPMRSLGEPGAYGAVLPGRAITPDGVDYYLRAGSAQAPYGASGGPLFHSIAVALPRVRKPLPIRH